MIKMVRKNTAEIKAYDYIRDKIVSGEWPPMKKIVEQEISDTLKISRSPIRSAIHQLVEEKYLKNIPYKGALVAQRKLTKKEYVDRLQVVELLIGNYIFQVESKYYVLPYDYLDDIVAQLEKEWQTTRNNDMLVRLEKLFAKYFFKSNPNHYYYTLALQLVSEVLEVEFRDKFGEIFFHKILISSLRSVLTFCKKQEYAEARKEVRIMMNNIMLEIVEY